MVCAVCALGSIPWTPGPQQGLFKVQSALVVLHVLVKDRNGAFVTNLTADAFRVFEGSRPQTIRFFATEDAPVSVGLVIDSSGSMQTLRDRVIAASAAFVESSNPRDEVFALVFNDDVRSVLPASVPFTSDVNTLRSALARAFVPAGRTALYDAVAEGLAYVATGTRDRQVLVILSDGGDNASHVAAADAVTRAEASNTVIYSVAVIDPAEPDASRKRLKQLAETTGGAEFAPSDVVEVGRVFQQIAREIRHGYTIGYEPSDTTPRQGFHRLRVDVQSPDGRRLETRTRTGYLGLAEQQYHAP
jgi:VWFA-related protein